MAMTQTAALCCVAPLPGAGRLATHLAEIVFVVALAGYLYRHKIFLRA